MSDETEEVGKWAKRLGAPQFYVLRTIMALIQAVAVSMILLRTYEII